MGYWNLLRLSLQTGHGTAVISNTTRRWNITALADVGIKAAARARASTPPPALRRDHEPPRPPQRTVSCLATCPESALVATRRETDQASAATAGKRQLLRYTAGIPPTVFRPLAHRR